MKIDKLTDEQKEWALIKQQILNTTPHKKVIYLNNRYKSIKKKEVSYRVSWLRAKLPFLYHKYFLFSYDLVIFCNIIVLMTFHHRQEVEDFKIIDKINKAFIIYLGFMILLKFMEKGLKLLKKLPGRYQIIVILMAYLNWFLQDHYNFEFQNDYIEKQEREHFNRIFNAFSKALQFTLIIFVFKRSKKINQFFQAIKNIIPILCSMFGLIFLFLFVYTVIAMNIFSYLKPQVVVNGVDIHFRTFFKAMY